jgi:hypothetical protein
MYKVLDCAAKETTYSSSKTTIWSGEEPEKSDMCWEWWERGTREGDVFRHPGVVYVSFEA